ncbi:MAG: thiol-disulfide isomerase/thioredoxin [Candidatus Azotimanducaceae bacterium]|jgi:thiol-disulfide isomerase/thioredoxin
MKTVMKTVLLGLVSLIFLIGCSPAEFSDTQGQGYRLADFNGGYLVVNYWATWCAPCIKEIPELIALGENHEDIEVIGVNFDMPEPEEMDRQIAQMKITFPVLVDDPHLLLGIDKPQVLPTTVIRGPTGDIKTLIGPQTEATLLAAMGR